MKKECVGLKLKRSVLLVVLQIFMSYLIYNRQKVQVILSCHMHLCGWLFPSGRVCNELP